jgi:hypothetical protein
MAALEASGVKKVPVVYIVDGGPVAGATPLKGGFATAQRFQETKATKGFLTGTLTPLSHDYLDAIKTTFGKNEGGVSFSR